MSLRKYIEETQRKNEAPVTGDEFDFQINESLNIECEIVEHSDDSYVVAVDELAYSMLEEIGLLSEEINEDTVNYAVEYSVEGSDDDQTNILRVIPVEVGNKVMYPEYIRTSLEKHPINKEMKQQGYRPKRTRAAWKGDIGHALMVAREEVKGNYIESEARRRQKNLEELEFASKHIDGTPYKTRYGNVTEAEYQGRTVKLGKPMTGDVKKYKVYVKDPKTGNVKKVNFGDKGMSIKRDDPSRRKNFRARHNCSSKKDRTSAGYWSCRMWSKKPVSQILKGK